MPKFEELWIDIGAESADEARSRVAIGDPAVLDVTPVQLSACASAPRRAIASAATSACEVVPTG